MKRQIYNSFVLPVSTYGEEQNGHSPTKQKQASSRIKDGQEYVKHNIPGQINKHLGKRNDKGHILIKQVTRWTRSWAGHVSRIRENRWTLRITSWKPYERKRPRGKPAR